MSEKRLCYECIYFDDQEGSPTHLKCLLRETYVHTPEKAERCLHYDKGEGGATMKWQKARKKPVIIEFREPRDEREEIKTREGSLFAYKGVDYVIRGVEGEIYPISKKIFYKTYEVIEE